jgi:hypothetical protein
VAQTPEAALVIELMRSTRSAYLALDHGDLSLRLSKERPGEKHAKG